MGKLDEIMAKTGGNIKASMGAGRAARQLHGATAPPPVQESTRLKGITRSKEAAEIALDRIDRDPKQPREEFDHESLERLAQSLKTRGQLQPIRVRWDEGRGVYVIVCGERRWRAAQLAGLPSLACVIMEKELTEGELLAMQLVENALRDDLRPVEQAKAYRALMDLNGWMAKDLAAELAIDKGSVSRALSLLELPEAVQETVDQGALAPSAAAEIARLPDPEIQEAVAEEVVKEGLKRDEVVKLVRAVKSRRSVPPPKPDPLSIDLGDCTITVRWKRASGTTAAEALERALAVVRQREQVA